MHIHVLVASIIINPWRCFCSRFQYPQVWTIISVWVRLFVRLLPISKNAHNSWTTWYILIKFCIRTHGNIAQPLTCVPSFFDGRGFAEHQTGRSWWVSENVHNCWTRWYIWINQILHKHYPVNGVTVVRLLGKFETWKIAENHKIYVELKTKLCKSKLSITTIF